MITRYQVKNRVRSSFRSAEEDESAAAQDLVPWSTHQYAMLRVTHPDPDAAAWRNLVVALSPSIADIIAARPVSMDHLDAVRSLTVGVPTRDPRGLPELLQQLSRLVTDSDDGTDIGRAVSVATLRVIQSLSPMFLLTGLVPPNFGAAGIGLTAMLESYCVAYRTVHVRPMASVPLADRLRDLWDVYVAAPRVTNREGVLSQVLELRMHQGDNPAEVLATVGSPKVRTAVVFLFIKSAAPTLPAREAQAFYEVTLRGLRESGQHTALRSALQLMTRDRRVAVDDILAAVYSRD